ncbi:ice-binding family protein [Microbacterium rhizomatis]|uniref:DUF3494 domain-containing protein n=1 Tax=Microbacterium rhizomatis TaxID=1631477 RepID=A0A5J5IZJ8_9MICO|nr:ice-binding family protein [Microbacterium rhizomatis]KAA9107507.1 DUF3494 domain-containing protein [Microbacterium rhizomatis]
MVAFPPHTRVVAAVFAASLSILLPLSAANAVTTIDGPVDLGTAKPFAVLAGSAVTNTGTSVLNGDVGLSPETSITGFPPGTVNGTIHPTDEVAAQAQLDLTTAYGVAAGLTPMQSGLGDLTGLTLTPGVYSGGELSVTGALRLEGTAESVWVFQAASTLLIGGSGIVTVTGGASACNVFWQVGSSATLDPGAHLEGTVMADVSVTAKTAATITGRLLARTGAVTLDTNTITLPSGCDTAVGAVRSSPTITSAAPASGEVGTAYSHTFTASSVPASAFSVTAGALPSGLTLDSATGVLSGQPTTAGDFDFDITASNGTSPDAVASYTIVVGAATVSAVTPTNGEVAIEASLAESGSAGIGSTPWVAGALLVVGVLLVMRSRTRRLAAVAPTRRNGLAEASLRRETFVSARTARKGTRSDRS